MDTLAVIIVRDNNVFELVKAGLKLGQLQKLLGKSGENHTLPHVQTFITF